MCIRDRVAPESANNAACGGAVIPMLTLGIPGDTATALLLAALTIHGVQSGPLLMSEGGGVFGVIVGLVLFANVVLLPVSLTGIKDVYKRQTPDHGIAGRPERYHGELKGVFEKVIRHAGKNRASFPARFFGF